MDLIIVFDSFLSLKDEDQKRDEVKHRHDDACKASFIN